MEYKEQPWKSELLVNSIITIKNLNIKQWFYGTCKGNAVSP